LKLFIKIAVKPLQMETWLLLTAYTKFPAPYPMVPSPITYDLPFSYNTSVKNKGRQRTDDTSCHRRDALQHTRSCGASKIHSLTRSVFLPQGNRVFTRSSKRPAHFQQMYSKYTC